MYNNNNNVTYWVVLFQVKPTHAKVSECRILPKISIFAVHAFLCTIMVGLAGLYGVKSCQTYHDRGSGGHIRTFAPKTAKV